MAGRKKKYGDDINSEILKLYVEEELSLNAISIKIKVHPQIIKRRLQSMNVQIRNKSQAMKLSHQNRKRVNYGKN